MITDQQIENITREALYELGREVRTVAITPVPHKAAAWWIDLGDEDRRIEVEYLAGDTLAALKDKIKILLQT